MRVYLEERALKRAKTLKHDDPVKERTFAMICLTQTAHDLAVKIEQEPVYFTAVASIAGHDALIKGAWAYAQRTGTEDEFMNAVMAATGAFATRVAPNPEGVRSEPIGTNASAVEAGNGHDGQA